MTGVVVTATAALAAGYLLGRLRPGRRAGDWETDQVRFTGAWVRSGSGRQAVVARGMSRLSALNLVPDDYPGEHSCPLCGNELTEPDPTIADMQTTLADLRGQLDSVQTVQPHREQALREIEQTATRLREQLRGIEGALSIIAEQHNQQAGP